MVSESLGRNERNAQVTPKLFTSEAEPPLIGRRLHGTSPTDRCGGTLWRGGSGSTMTRMHRANGEALLAPSGNRRSREPYNRRHREVGDRREGDGRVRRSEEAE